MASVPLSPVKGKQYGAVDHGTGLPYADNTLVTLSEEKSAPTEVDGDVPASEWTRFSVLLGLFQVVILVLFALFVDYPKDFDLKENVQYVFFLDVTVMMLVGFGFLMTFQRSNGLSAVGFTFLITTTCIPLAVLMGRFFASVADNTTDRYPGLTSSDQWGTITVDINALLQGDFASAAVLISFGALIGKVTPSQLLLLTIMEVVFYSMNKEVFCIGGLGTLDMGGTIFIHLFGAYFGLAAAKVFGPPEGEDPGSSRTSDMFSLVGTVFLWIYWPSFNGATAGIGHTGELHLTTVNTVLALCGSTLMSFVTSAFFNQKISTVDLQNATLAGGVAIGASSNLHISPAAAFATGMGAALISCIGFNKLQSLLEEGGLKLHDSCGVHNLHGLPAIFGAIVVTIATGSGSTVQGTVKYPKGDHQCWAQLGGAGITLVFALVSGSISGFVVKNVMPGRVTPFRDDPFWTVAEKSD